MTADKSPDISEKVGCDKRDICRVYHGEYRMSSFLGPKHMVICNGADPAEITTLCPCARLYQEKKELDETAMKLVREYVLLREDPKRRPDWAPKEL